MTRRQAVIDAQMRDRHGLQAQIKVVRDRHLWTNALSACAKASARRIERLGRGFVALYQLCGLLIGPQFLEQRGGRDRDLDR